MIEEATRQMIARITSFARDYEDEFVKIVVSEKYKQIQTCQGKNQKKLAIMKARQTELDILFEQLYEERTLGVLPEKVFLKMAKKYNGEQAELDTALAKLEKEVAKDKSNEMNVDSFLKMVQKYTVVNELTPEILRHFIDKIVVHHREETGNQKTQKIEFYFNFVGKVELPYLTEFKQYKNCFGTKKENHTAEAV